MVEKKKLKKRVWGIPLVTTVVVAILIIVGISCANVLLTSIVNEQLENQVKVMKNVRVSYDDISVDLWRGSAYVNNLTYCSIPDTVLHDDTPGFLVKVDMAQFKFVSYWSYLQNKAIKIGKVSVSDVSAVVNYHESMSAKTNQEGMLVVNKTDTVMVASSDSVKSTPTKMDMSQSILAFVASINVDKVSINNGSLRFKDLKSKMIAECDSLYLSVRNLGYDFAVDSISYNDSVYILSVKNIKFVQPDGKYTLTVGSLASKNARGIVIDELRHVCNVKKENLAEVNGKVPVVWSDVYIKSLRTSKVNVVRSVLNGNLQVKSIDINGGEVNIYQDNTYPFTTVQRPLQTMLAKLPIPMELMRVNVRLDRLYYTLKPSNLPPATLSMNTLDVVVKRLSNFDMRDIVALMRCSIDGGGGYMTMNLRLLKDNKYTWRNRVIIENANLAAFNGFLGSLAGVEVGGHLNRMESYAVGDTLTANGRFVMEYNDLDAKVVKGTSPIKALNENSKAINGLIKVILPKSNPLKPGEDPKSFRVVGKRDLYKPYFIYIMSPVFKGLEETMLSPFFLHKEIKDGKGVYTRPDDSGSKKSQSLWEKWKEQRAAKKAAQASK